MKRILKALLMTIILCILVLNAASCDSIACPGCNAVGANHSKCEKCEEYLCVGDHTNCTETEKEKCPGCNAAGDEHGKCEVCEEYVCVGDHTECSKDIQEVCTGCKGNVIHAKCEKCEEYLCVGDHTNCTETEEEKCPGCESAVIHGKCAFCFNYVCTGDHSNCKSEEETVCPGCNQPGGIHKTCGYCDKYFCVGDHSECKPGGQDITCPGCNQQVKPHDVCEKCLEYVCVGNHDKCFPEGVCSGCGKPGQTHEICDVCKTYICVGNHYECHPNEPCYCGGGTFEGKHWTHAKCPECDKYLCEDHELCANCNEYIGCMSYCPFCHNHSCYHPKEVCDHCGGELTWCTERDKIHQLRDHYTLCEICQKYRCEGDYNAHEECDILLKNCPECGEDGAREEHKCDNCAGYICDGKGEMHYITCPSCPEFLCENEVHGSSCSICGEPLCQGDHTNCEPQDNPGDNDKPKECNHVTDGGTLKFYEKKEPTCQESGWHDHYVCDICHWYFSADGSTTGPEHDKLIRIGTVSCSDGDNDTLCDYCKLPMLVCVGCGERGVAHEQCECGMYVCIPDHEFMCTKDQDSKVRFCERCQNNLQEGMFHDNCGYCIECCTCDEEMNCIHGNTSYFEMNCGYNMQYEHRKCNDCGKILCVVYYENGPEMFECVYCDPNPLKCGHDSMSTLYMEDIHCESGLIHYVCSECQMVFLYSEGRGAYVCGICGDYSVSNICSYCRGAAEYICGVCGMCSYCCGCINSGEGDDNKENTCPNCYSVAESLCAYCYLCDNCCTCDEIYGDPTEYCPRCRSYVYCTDGYEADCIHDGFLRYYRCDSCSYMYTVEDEIVREISENEIFVPSLGHTDADGNYTCDRCRMLYSSEYCVFCGGAVPCYECIHHYMEAVSPVSYVGVKK